MEACTPRATRTTRRWPRTRTLWLPFAALAAGAALILPLGSVAAPSALPACTSDQLVPSISELSVVQGLPYGTGGQTYARLGRGKETIVRAYLTVPTTCTVGKTQSITPVGATLTVTNADGPKPALTSYNVLSGRLGSTSQIEPTTDPLFVVPASYLAPTSTTDAFNTTFALQVNYTRTGATGVLTTPATAPNAQKTVPVNRKLTALRVLVQPIGDPSATTAQWSPTAQQALQKLMTVASYVTPVETGTGDLSPSARGGIRYLVNQGLVDARSLGLYATGTSTTSRICLNGANWGTSQVASGAYKDLTLKSELLQRLVDYNRANPTAQADLVLGVADEAVVWPSSNSAGLACDDGRAAVPAGGTPGQVGWARVTYNGANSPGLMELLHALGISTASQSLHSLNVEADTPSGSTAPDPNRGYSVLQRRVLHATGAFGDDHSAMNYNTFSNPYTLDKILLEPGDWTATACNTNGIESTLGSCTLSTAIGTSNGVAAGTTMYSITGTLDGSTVDVVNGHTIPAGNETGVEGASTLQLEQWTGSCGALGTRLSAHGLALLEDLGHHDEEGGTTPGARQNFSAVVPFDSSATAIRITVAGAQAFCRSPGGSAPTVTSASTVEPGTLLRSFSLPACCNGRSVAFDGERLFATLADPFTTIYELTTTGTLVRTYNAGVPLGALAYDPTNGHLIGGHYNPTVDSTTDGRVYDIVLHPDGTPDGSGRFPVTRTDRFQFAPDEERTTCRGGNPGAIDGLERLPSGAFALSGNLERRVHLLDSTGARTSFFDTSCNSGITNDGRAGADAGIWLSILSDTCCDGGSTLEHRSLAGVVGTTVTIPASYEAMDLAFDDETFAPTCAVWTNEATGGAPEIRAIAVPCFGGGEDGSDTVGVSFTGSTTDLVGTAYFTCNAPDGPFFPIASGLNDVDLTDAVSTFVFYWSANFSCGEGSPTIITSASNGLEASPLTPTATNSFTVESISKPPSAVIIAPVHETVFRADATIAFNGSAYDPEDGAIPQAAGTSVAWTVDGNPAGSTLAFDKTVTELGLAPGAHTVTFTATDSDGHQDSHTVTIHVTGDDTPPTLGLTPSAGPGWTTSATVTIAVSASDTAPDDTGLAALECTDNGAAEVLAPPFAPAPSHAASFAVTGDGPHQITCKAVDGVGNETTANETVLIDATACLGQPEHSVLQPLDADGTSVFKKRSTVPVKFRVCDAAGEPIGAPSAVVTSQRLTPPEGCTVNPSPLSTAAAPVLCARSVGAGAVDEPVISSAADASFRWSSSERVWIFNLSTSNLTAGMTYTYYVPLVDGTNMYFKFAVR